MKAMMLFVALSAAVISAAQTRDTPAAAATGTSVIRGTAVTSDANARPLKGARIVLSGVPGGRAAITDNAGRFAFTGLPAGNYTLTAGKPAYLTTAYGATRFGRAGTTIVLADKQTTDVTIAMTLGGVVGGVIRDIRGRPMPGVNVGVVPVLTTGTARPSFTPAPATTDDRGEFRLYGVPPGQYYVAAVMQNYFSAASSGRRSVAENDALLEQLQRRVSDVAAVAPGAAPKKPEPLPDAPASGFAPMFYPGTARVDSAAVVTVTVGAERLGVDFSIVPVRAASVDGTVQGPVSKLDRVELSLVIDGPEFPSFSSSRPILTLRPDLQGRFHYDNMPPGRYTILARAIAGEGDPSVPDKNQGVGFGSSSGFDGSSAASTTAPEGLEYVYGRADLDIDGANTTGVSLALLPGSVATGKLVFDRAAAVIPADLTAIRIRLSYIHGMSMSISNNTSIGNSFLSGPSTPVRADGGWTARGIPPATFNIGATLPAAISKDWWLRSAMLNGRDLLDGPFDVQPGQDLSGIVFTLTDRHSELSGTLTTAAGKAASDYFIIVCPADPKLWMPGSRRVKSLRPTSDGSFSVKDLPAGDYIIAALTDVAPGEWNDPQWLALVAPGGAAVKVTDGEKTVQNLRIGGGY